MVKRFLPALLLAGCLPTGRFPVGGEARLQSDLVRPPRLVQSASSTTQALIRVEGYATSGHRVELYVNALLEGETLARSDGRFEFENVRLRPGLNIITAVAIDGLGNRSDSRATGGGPRSGIESQLTPELRIVLQN